MSSTPYHSLVPSVARAADDVMMAGITPAKVAAITFFLISGVCMAIDSTLDDFATPKANDRNIEVTNEIKNQG